MRTLQVVADGFVILSMACDAGLQELSLCIGQSAAPQESQPSLGSLGIARHQGPCSAII
jgi:hypothetical protein